LRDKLFPHIKDKVSRCGRARLRGALPISDVLLSCAADLDADLIGAGAYHHG
jgi:hypothetical protein